MLSLQATVLRDGKRQTIPAEESWSPAVLIAVGIVAGLQLTFTYAPFMQQFFATRSLDFFQGAAILAIGITGFLIIEIEKMIRRRIGLTSGKRYKPVLNTEQDR